MIVLIIANTYKKEALALSKEIEIFLLDKSIQSEIYHYTGESKDIFINNYAFVITLGGDGTVLYAARYCASKKIPIFPINLGEFGFIAGIEPDNWKESLLSFIGGNEVLTERMLIQAKVLRKGICVYSSPALNDIVISGKAIAKIVKLQVFFDSISFGMYKADGIIISTPTGSTAYSAASGGPIVSPDISAFIVTPICSFSLSNRPIVLPPTGTLKVSVLDSRHNDTILSIDGQESFLMNVGDEVLIDTYSYPVALVGCDSTVFYSALQSKLNWSGIPVIKQGLKKN